MRKPTSLVALALIALAAAAPFWKALVGDQCILSFDSRLFRPYSVAAPPDLATRPANFVTSDLNAYVYPGVVQTVREVRSGELPLWDPWQLAGQPSLANLPVASLYPPNWLIYFIDPLSALAWITVFHLALGGIFCFFYLRAVRLAFWPALVAGVGLALTSWMTVRFHQTHLVSTGAWMFGLLLGAERLLRSPTIRGALLFAALTAGAFLAGFPQLAVIEAAGAGLYLLLRLLEPGRLLRGRTLALGVLGVFLGVVVSAAHFLPTASLFGESLRRTMVDSSGAAERGLRPVALVNLVLPEFFGHAVYRDDIPGNLHEYLPHRLLLASDVQENPVENALFPGGVILALALVGMATGLRAGASRALFLLLLSGLVLSLRSPLLEYLSDRIPTLASASPKRSLVLVALPLVGLAGFGLSALLEEGAHSLRRSLALLSLAFSLLLLLGLSLLRFLDPAHALDLLSFLGAAGTGTLEEAGQFVRHTFREGVPRAATYLFFGLFLLLSNRTWSGFGRRLLLPALLALVLVEMGVFAVRFNPLQERAGQYPETPALTFLRKSGERSVHFHEPQVAPASLSAMVPFRSLDGVKPLVLHRFGEYLENIEPGIFNRDDPRVAHPFQSPGSLEHPSFLRAATPLVITDVPIAEVAGLELAYRGDAEGLGIYRQTRALERFRLVGGYQVVEDASRRLELLDDPGLDPQQVVLLEADPGDPFQPGPAIAPGGRIVVEEDLPGRLEVSVLGLERPAFLLVADTFHDGWRLTVDGDPAGLLVADHTFRAVALLPGDHLVVMVYRPLAVTAGFLLTALGLLTIGALGLMTFWRKQVRAV
ncbi:MAG: hypothetical protein V2A76_03420 [Planctomycetota bacterium]